MPAQRLVAIAFVLLLAACGSNGGDSTASAVAGDSSAAGSVASTANADGFSLDYEKFTLDNGLEVVLQVDDSDPIVAFSTVVHAGSNREVTGRTGFAHFFEHMAFNDSENVPRGWNRARIPEWGGNRNGGTWSDGTGYYEVVPKDAFDKILWIDSDRLGYMINTVTEDALAAEIQVVKNEKRQNYDNVAYGYTSEVVAKNLYPQGHPYSWSVIGALPDLQAATLEDLKAFYDNYYGAANATLAIVGDIDLAETREKVELWFGEIRRGPAVAPLPPMPVMLAETKSLYFEDEFARLPQLRLTFPTVESYHADEAALNALARILGGSKNSPLYREIVEVRKLAPDVATAASSRELAGEFILGVTANAGVDLDDVMAGLQAGLAEFERAGIPPEELERVKAEQETALYANLSTVLGKANRMARDNEFAGDPAYAVAAAAAINALSVDDVMAAFGQYIAGKPAVITSFVPRGRPELALEGAELATVWIEEVTAASADEIVTRGEVGEYTRTPTEHDRSEPPFAELPLVTMPPVWEVRLANHVRLLGIENNEIPLVSLELVIAGGGMLDPLDKKGMGGLLARLMNEGTATKTAAELEQAIGLLGSRINVSATNEEFIISATTLARNFEVTVALLREMLSSPRFEATEFERVKSALLTNLTAREADPVAIASSTLFRLLYGDSHPLGTPALGTRGTVEPLTLADLRAHFARLHRLPAVIHIAGDVSAERATTAFSTVAEFFDADKESVPEYEIPDYSNAGQVFFVDVPDAKQSQLLLGQLTVPSNDPDAVRLSFVNERFGGGGSGDLSQVLRIEKGYTYGAGSGLSSGLAPQPFYVQTSVRANATGDSLAIIRDMLNAYGPELTDADVEMTRQKVIKMNTRGFESLGALLNTLQSISKYGKSTRFIEEEQAILLAMGLDEYQQLAAEYMDESRMTYVIVGDKATQWDAVNEFAGGDAIELDIYGAPVAAE